ncbi:hypothetical protein [Embleya hyalina]|uniref:Uncharacterized protein n=1 Tax=Embleya hyalina TaxID=516124 RepID=A0A401YQH7_9ACTN|nr:hypothetical protein [Embleya hyalina]GCD96874.1 hypothetical protein EHYA_04561 [Embleya hyalina]
MANVRGALVAMLAREFGEGVDTEDPVLHDGRLVGHFALRAVEWLLDTGGFGADDARYTRLWERLGARATLDTLASAHRRHERAWLSDADVVWPLPPGTYVELIQEALGSDLANLPMAIEPPPPGRAAVRFAAPFDENIARSIAARTDFEGHLDPRSWVIQRCIGHDPRAPDPTDTLDRFVAHWSYRRSVLSPWVEVNRSDAVDHLVRLQRTSLLYTRPPGRRPSADVARARVELFLACFGDDTRFFTNGPWYGSRRSEADRDFRSPDFGITDATVDSGVVMIDARVAGLWWHAEQV